MYGRDAWKPNFKRTLLPGYPQERLKAPKDDMKLTTYQKQASAVEDYWNSRDQYSKQDQPSRPRTAGARYIGKSTAGAVPGKIPGGESEIASEIKKRGQSTAVQLGQDEYPYKVAPPKQHYDLPEKEKERFKGIVGYTGNQPLQFNQEQFSRSQEDQMVSSTYAINGFDQRKQFIKGVPGYTGHQPSEESLNKHSLKYNSMELIKGDYNKAVKDILQQAQG